MDIEKLKNLEAEWFRQHELSDDQLEQLIENKFIRAKEYRAAFVIGEEQAELA